MLYLLALARHNKQPTSSRVFDYSNRYITAIAAKKDTARLEAAEGPSHLHQTLWLWFHYYLAALGRHMTNCGLEFSPDNDQHG